MACIVVYMATTRIINLFKCGARFKKDKLVEWFEEQQKIQDELLG